MTLMWTRYQRIYAVFTESEYPSVLIKSDSGQLTCWPQGTGPLDQIFTR